MHGVVNHWSPSKKMLWDNLKSCLEKGDACLNGVYGWFWEIGMIVAIVLIFNFAFKKLLFILKNRFHARGQLLQESFVTALYMPLSLFIWFFAGVEIIDFISLQVISQTLFTNKKIILGVGVALALGWFLMRWKNHVTHYILTRNRTFARPYEPTTVDIIDKLATVSIILLTALLSLEITGSGLNTLIAFGGISGLALAFASQEVIASFFGGLMTYITQPFVIGDWIILPEKNIEGHVEEIGWYMTKVRTFDKTPIYVPNSNFSKIVVINPSRMSHRRIKEIIGLRYCDYPRLKTVMEEIKRMLRENRDIVSEMSQGAYFIAFGTYSLDIEVSAYTYETTTEGFKKIKEQLFFSIGDILAKHQVEFAFPTTCVELSNPSKPQSETVFGNLESKDLLEQAGGACTLNT